MDSALARGAELASILVVVAGVIRWAFPRMREPLRRVKAYYATRRPIRAADVAALKEWIENGLDHLEHRVSRVEAATSELDGDLGLERRAKGAVQRFTLEHMADVQKEVTALREQMETLRTILGQGTEDRSTAAELPFTVPDSIRLWQIGAYLAELGTQVYALYDVIQARQKLGDAATPYTREEVAQRLLAFIDKLQNYNLTDLGPGLTRPPLPPSDSQFSLPPLPGDPPTTTDAR